MSENIIAKNFAIYRSGLEKLFGVDIADKLIETLGGEDKVANASYAATKDTGAAYAGSFVKNVIKLVNIANKINGILPEEIKVNAESLNKICMLSQISKVLLFEENDNNYEIINRGMVYKYAQLAGALRTGERSTLIASNAGITFTEIEYEAMRAIDNASGNDNYTKYFSSNLSMIIRQAYEIINAVNRENSQQ